MFILNIPFRVVEHLKGLSFCDAVLMIGSTRCNFSREQSRAKIGFDPETQRHRWLPPSGRWKNIHSASLADVLGPTEHLEWLVLE